MGRSALSGRGPLPRTVLPCRAWPHALPSCKWAGRGWLFLDGGECWAWVADHMAGSSPAFSRRVVEGQKLPLASAPGCWHRP